jgi:hypothetical protein
MPLRNDMRPFHDGLEHARKTVACAGLATLTESAYS